MLAINGNKLNLGKFREACNFPCLLRINEFFRDAFSWLMDIFTDIVKDREGVEFQIIVTHEFDYIHLFRTEIGNAFFFS